MSKLTVGIVDYGSGNHASILSSLRGLGYRCVVSDEIEVLNKSDLLLLPGVGAFPPAMDALNNKGLVEYLQRQAREQRPILGICLGMQLLAEASYEHCLTSGIGLIPGEIVALSSIGPLQWHIGWNTVEVIQDDPLLRLSDGQAFYFNHSYVYQGPKEYQICVVRQKNIFPVVIRKENVVGIQFHPEKSQGAGRQLMGTVIEGLTNWSQTRFLKTGSQLLRTVVEGLYNA